MKTEITGFEHILYLQNDLEKTGNFLFVILATEIGQRIWLLDIYYT